MNDPQQKIEHKSGCDFESRIAVLESYSFIIGSGEVSGSLDIDRERIYLSDGWNSLPDIRFNYCPICGTLLQLDEEVVNREAIDASARS